ncbi:MAG TPA: NlpC/P60 family protein [Defluviitaleaceae bacterium]|nr:NlpC/P60 family protein [Defluviitaleaceae bacterium]HPT75503.1 NlpC/P60 family protein [Defluviitaleaceae bacterium]
MIGLRRVLTVAFACGVFSLATMTDVYGQTLALVNKDGVEVWDKLDETKEVIVTVDKDEELEIVGTEGDCYIVLLDDESKGYVLKDDLNIKSMDAISTGDRVNIRVEPNTSCKVLGQVNRSDPLVVTGKTGNWYKIDYKGQEAYIFGDYVKVLDKNVLADKKEEAVTSYNKNADEIITYAKQFIGTPYRYGGTDLTRGVDCSGFTQSVMKKFGISLSRSSSSQANDGYYVAKSDLQPGDLVFFDTSGPNNGAISHVAIYIGNNSIIHSECSRGVTIDSLSEDYYARRYVKAVRVLK